MAKKAKSEPQKSKSKVKAVRQTVTKEPMVPRGKKTGRKGK